MLRTRVSRLLASICALGSVLCLAAGAPILFIWAIDSSRPVSTVPLVLATALMVLAGMLFVVRRGLLGTAASDHHR